MSKKPVAQQTGTGLAIIAGAGRFPFLVAEEARRHGHPVIAFGVKGWADPSLAERVDAYEELDVSAVDTLIDRLNAHGVRQVIMAGKVTKQVLLDTSGSLAAQIQSPAGAVNDASVNALLGRIGKRLAQAGVMLLDSATFLQSSLCPLGVLTERIPSAEENEDVH